MENRNPMENNDLLIMQDDIGRIGIGIKVSFGFGFLPIMVFPTVNEFAKFISKANEFLDSIKVQEKLPDSITKFIETIGDIDKLK